MKNDLQRDLNQNRKRILPNCSINLKKIPVLSRCVYHDPSPQSSISAQNQEAAMKEEILVTTDSIEVKGLLIIGMSIFLYYLVVVVLTLVNFPRL